MKPDILIGTFTDDSSDEEAGNSEGSRYEIAQPSNGKNKRQVVVSKLKQEQNDGPPVFLVRFETEHRYLFKYWKYTGICPVEWEEGEDGGTYVQKLYLFNVTYIYMYIWIIVSTFFTLSSVVNTDGNHTVQLSEVFETTCLLFAVAVVPSVQAYSAKLLFEGLPEILTEIGRLNYLTLPERPETVPLKEVLLFGLVTRTHSSELRKLKGNRNATLDDVIHWLPCIAIFVSVAIFLLVLVVGIIISTVDGSILTNDLKSFLVLTMVCMAYPFHMTHFMLRLITWMRSIYEAFTVKFQKIEAYKRVYKFHDQVNSEKWIDAVDEITNQFDVFTSLLKNMQNRFLTYIISLSWIAIIIVSMMCCTKLFRNIEMIIFLWPLLESMCISFLLAWAAESLLEKHHHLLNAVVKFADQNLTQLTPAEQHRLVRFQTSLEEHPPFLTTYCDLKLSIGLFFNLVCFVLSYGVILSQVMTQGVIADYDIDSVLQWVTTVSSDGCVTSCNKTVTM